MNGLIDGTAPPFIVMSIAFVALAWLPAFLLNVGRRAGGGGFGKYLTKLATVAVVPPLAVFSLVFYRIVRRGCEPLGDDAICMFLTVDRLIMMLLAITFALIVAITILCLRAAITGNIPSEG